VAEAAPLATAYRAIAFDLDGTVYLGDQVIPGAPETVDGVRGLGIKVCFLTNNAVRPPEAVAEKLSRLGVKAAPNEVLTSAHAVVRLLGGEEALRGRGVLLVGGRGLHQALEQAGAKLLEPDTWRSAEVVVAGLDPKLTYEKVRAATLAIAAGARFVGSNADANLPTPEGPWPGAGSVLALLSTATGTQPEIAGKPERALFEAVAAAVGEGPRLMVGDRPDTDLAGASPLGWATALVLTGVANLGNLLDVEVVPDHLLRDVNGLLGPRSPVVRQAPGSSPAQGTMADALGPRAPAGLDRQAPAPAGTQSGHAGHGGHGSGHLRLVAESGESMVGEVVCGWSDGVADLERLSVDPASRGRLVGSLLLLAACVRLRERGVRRIEADAGRGDGFLERLGFSREGDLLGRDLKAMPPPRP
jgi:HAD superfamily hydrolase (TIGR01450 family)